MNGVRAFHYGSTFMAQNEFRVGAHSPSVLLFTEERATPYFR